MADLTGHTTAAERVFGIAELTLFILRYLQCPELITLQRVSRAWRQACLDTCAKFPYKLFLHWPDGRQYIELQRVFVGSEYNIRTGRLTAPLAAGQLSPPGNQDVCVWKISCRRSHYSTPKLVQPTANPLLGSIMWNIIRYTFHDRYAEEPARQAFMNDSRWPEMFPCVPAPRSIRLKIDARPDHELQIEVQDGVRFGDIVAAIAGPEADRARGTKIRPPVLWRYERSGRRRSKWKDCVGTFESQLWTFGWKEIVGCDAWQWVDADTTTFEDLFITPQTVDESANPGKGVKAYNPDVSHIAPNQWSDRSPPPVRHGVVPSVPVSPAAVPIGQIGIPSYWD